MPDLKLGYKASAEQFAPRELVELGVLAEQHGFDSATVSDHFQPWRHNGGHAPFSLAWMTAVGERTQRIQLGTSVLTPTFRYNPAVIAQAFATMGMLYPGRVMLGIGTGEALNEIATGGCSGEWPEFKERFARLREAVEMMRALWSGQRTTFDGQYFHTVGASIYDAPIDGIPIYVAAGGPLVARYAGREADGFICTSGKGMNLYTDKLMPALAEGAAAAIRPVHDIDRMIEIKISYDPDPHLALEADSDVAAKHQCEGREIELAPVTDTCCRPGERIRAEHALCGTQHMDELVRFGGIGTQHTEYELQIERRSEDPILDQLFEVVDVADVVHAPAHYRGIGKCQPDRLPPVARGPLPEMVPSR